MKKLLVIDDETAIIQTIQTYFSDKGYTVLGAENVKRAYELLPEGPDMRIRKKLQEYGCDPLIETVWGIGYRWKS